MTAKSFPAAAGVLLGVAVLVPQVDAQGLTIVTVDSKRHSSTILNDTRFFQKAIELHLSRNRDQWIRQIQDYLHEREIAKGSGLRLYGGPGNPRIPFRIGQPTIQMITPNRVTLDLKNNYMYFRLRQPTVLGDYADPAFSAYFDVRLDMTLALPTTQKPQIEATSAVAYVSQARISSENVAGGLVGSVVNYFLQTAEGHRLLADATNKYLRADVTKAVNEKLGQANMIFTLERNLGYTQIQSEIKQVRLTVTMTQPSPLAKFGPRDVRNIPDATVPNSRVGTGGPPQPPLQKKGSGLPK